MGVGVGVVCSTASPTTDTMPDIFRSHRQNASRISDEDWEKFRPVLLDKSQTMTFPQLADYMVREHGFFAK